MKPFITLSDGLQYQLSDEVYHASKKNKIIDYVIIYAARYSVFLIVHNTSPTQKKKKKKISAVAGILHLHRNLH